MSKTKHWLMTLQEHPTWKDGYEAYLRRVARTENPHAWDKGNPVRSLSDSYLNYMAWFQGWDDAKFDEYMEMVNER